MRTTALKKYLAGVALLATTSFCAAQAVTVDRPVITLTAGQGGYIVVPNTQAQPQRFALTGEPDRSREEARRWQSVAGPRYRVGQAEITLPAAR